MADSEGAAVRKRVAVERRAARTRKALLAAFVSLFFEVPYERISVAAIVRRARVGRSTFYEHFVDKEDILADSIRAPLSGLAAAVEPKGDARLVRASVEHFVANAGQARRLLAGATRRAITRVLAAMIAERLPFRASPSVERRRRLTATAIAEAQMGTLAACLRGELQAPPGELAAALGVLARACARAMGGDGV